MLILVFGFEVGGEGGAADASGAGVGELGFDFGDVGREGAETGGIDAGAFADESEAIEDGGFGTFAATSGLGGGESFFAAEAEDGHGGGWREVGLGFKLLDESESAGGGVEIDFFGLGSELREEFAGGFEGDEGAGRCKGEDGLEIEQGCAGIVEVREADGVGEGHGWGEENERSMDAGGEFGDGAAEWGAVVLDGQDEGDGSGGPGADLFGVGGAEGGDAGGAVERAGNGVAEAVPVHNERGDFFDGEWDVRAVVGVTDADADGGGFVVAMDDVVAAAALARAGDKFWEDGVLLEAEIFEVVKTLAEVIVPDSGDGGLAGEPFE